MQQYSPRSISQQSSPERNHRNKDSTPNPGACQIFIIPFIHHGRACSGILASHTSGTPIIFPKKMSFLTPVTCIYR